MRITITGRNIDLTDGLKAAVEDKLSKLDKYFSAETEADAVAWALEQVGKGKRLSLCTNRYVYSDQDRETMFQYAVQMRGAAEETSTSSAPRPVKPPEPAADEREDDDPWTLSDGSRTKRTPLPPDVVPPMETTNMPPQPDVVPAMETTDAPPRREASGCDAVLGAASGIAGLVLLILAIVQRTIGWFDGKWKALFAVMILVAAALIGLSVLILHRIGKKHEKQSYITVPIAGSPSRPEGANGQKEAPKRPTENQSHRKETIEDIYRM